MTPSSLFKNPTLYLIAILLLGALFRFGELGTVRHGYDEGYQAYDALRMLDGGQWRLIGQPSSVFLDNPPLMPYLQALPLLFWRSLWGVYIFITALNTVAILFVYQATHKVLGQTAAFVAAFLFAISPWVVHFSRTPWTQGLLPFFTAVIAWGLWPTLVKDEPQSKWHFLLGAIAAIAMMQTYIVAFGILLPLGLLTLLFWQRLPKRPFWLATTFFSLTLITFAIGLATGTERNSSKFQDFLLEQEIHFTPQAALHSVRYVTGLNFDGEETVAESWRPWQTAAHIVLGLALLLGIGQAIMSLRHGGPPKRLAITLLIWFGSPTLALSFLPTLVHPHYLMLTLPAGQLLAAWGLLPLLQQSRLRWATLILLGSLALLFRFNLIAVGQAVAANPDGYGFNGWPLAEIVPVGQTIRDLSATDISPRRIYAEDHEALLSSISATYIDSVAELSFGRFVLLPGDAPMLYVLLGRSPTPSLLGPQQQYDPNQTVRLGDNTAVSFIQVPPYTAEAAAALPQTAVNWTSDAGLTLLGYTFTTPPPFTAGQTAELIVYWRVAELHPDRATWFVQSFYQILNPDWQLVANIEGNGQWGHRWRQGDVYVERITIPIPNDLEANDYRLLIGLFDPINEQNFYLNAPTSREYGHTIPISIEK